MIDLQTETETRVVGQSAERIDGWEKVTGAARFVDYLEFGPGLLHACVVESPHAHARIGGFCAPGVILTATELLARHPALGGNLCRCTGYTPVIEANEAAGGKS